jgi:RimJ/RimL family protein N-acetyltransferase
LAIAKREGLRRITGIALSSNSGMLALARRMGFRLAPDPSSATITTLTLEFRS